MCDLIQYYELHVYVADDSDATEILIRSRYSVEEHMRECLNELAAFFGIQHKVVQDMFERD